MDYPWLGVSCTLYHGNTDFGKILKRFAEKERIIGRPLSFFPHIMHETSGKNEVYALTKEDMDSIYHQWKERVEKLVIEYEKYGVVNQRYMGLFRGLLGRAQAVFSFGETYCIHRNLKRLRQMEEISTAFIFETTRFLVMLQRNGCKRSYGKDSLLRTLQSLRDVRRGLCQV